MRYLSGGLFHQNTFPFQFKGPNLFFPWLPVFYYLTDAFVLVLIMSSASHPHSLGRSGRLQMSFKIGIPKTGITGKHRCFYVKFLITSFFIEHLRWLLLSILLFMNLSSFTSSLPHSHYFLTVLLLSSFEETLLSLYHYYYIVTIIIAK